MVTNKLLLYRKELHVDSSKNILCVLQNKITTYRYGFHILFFGGVNYPIN